MRVIPIASRHGVPDAGAGLRWVLVAPHRLFFSAAAIGLVLVSVWWFVVLWSRALGAALPTAVPPTWVHGWSMINGFLPLFMFGFLFTAGPKWLHMPEPATRSLVLPAVLATAGVPVVLIGAAVLAWLAAGGVAICTAGWALLLFRFTKLVIASPSPDQVHARFVLVFFCFGTLSLLLFAWGVTQQSADAVHGAAMMSIWLFLAPVFVTVAHRLIPFFTGSVVPALDAWRPLWLLAALNGIVIAHGVLPVLQVFAPTAAGAALRVGGDLAGAALVFFVAWRWGLRQSMRNRLLAMLHLAFVWLGIALALYAWQQMAVRWGMPEAALGLAPLHALTMGFFASMAFAMVTRVTAGHGGRQLLADPLSWTLFGWLQASAVLRVAVDVFPGTAWWLTPLVITLWCCAWLPWSGRNLAIYLRARADGRPG